MAGDLKTARRAASSCTFSHHTHADFNSAASRWLSTLPALSSCLPSTVPSRCPPPCLSTPAGSYRTHRGTLALLHSHTVMCTVLCITRTPLICARLTKKRAGWHIECICWWTQKNGKYTPPTDTHSHAVTGVESSAEHRIITHTHTRTQQENMTRLDWSRCISQLCLKNHWARLRSHSVHMQPN